MWLETAMDEVFAPKGQTVIALQKQLNLLDHIPVGACVLRRDGTVLFWNACLENWTHISRAQIVGRKLNQYFSHLSQPKYTRRLQETFDGGFTIVFSAQLHPHLIPCTCANGQLRVQQTIVTAIPAANGVGFDALMSIQDATDLTQQIQNYKQIQAQARIEVKQRQSIEDQLRADHDLLNTILNNSAAAIVMTDVKGTIIFANQRGEDVLRLVKSGVPGQAYSPPQWQVTDFNGNRLAEGALPVAQVITAGKAVFNLERCLEWADGTRCFLSMNGVPLWHEQPNESIANLVFSISDITLQQQSAIELQHRYDQDRLVDQIVLHIRQSLNLRDILQTTVTEIRTFLRADRVLIYRLDSTEGHGRVVAEACHPDFPSLLEWSRRSELIPSADDPSHLQAYQYPTIQAIDDIVQSGFHDDYIAQLQSFSVKARLAIPVLLNRDISTSHSRSKPVSAASLWGWLIVHQCRTVRAWQAREIELLQRLENQLAVAIQQSELLQQVHHLNINLERQVHARTLELQQALTLEATLKRITDKVRDSLDENQILQSVVRELGEALEVHYCDTALYGFSQTSSHQTSSNLHSLTQANAVIQHQYISANVPLAIGCNHHLHIEKLFDVYDQLFQGQPVVFCQLDARSSSLTQTPFPERPDSSAILACPILDDQGVLGDLWLFRASASSFSDREIRLVQQVANQCAIAIRQARLYKTSEQKVEELAQLNHFKNDFLNTISHELRTPIISIRMALQTLEMLFKRSDKLQENLSQAHQYFHILEDECKREAKLIDDLLDLTRLEAGTEPLVYTSVNPRNWIPHVAEGFERRMKTHQQQLQFNLPDDLPTLVTDLTILERILTELLNNAYKYTPAGETITIAAQILKAELRSDHLSPDLCFPSSRSLINETSISVPCAKRSSLTPTKTPCFLISVTNTGIEIPAADLDRVFDKFYRVPSTDAWQSEGTGLGLALVKRMAEYLGGSVWVESEQNCTRFVLQLVVAQ